MRKILRLSIFTFTTWCMLCVCLCLHVEAQHHSVLVHTPSTSRWSQNSDVMLVA